MRSIENVSVELTVVLGKASMPIQQLLRMGRGAVIPLETEENEDVLILANNAPIARGEVVVQGDNIGVEINEKFTCDNDEAGAELD